MLQTPCQMALLKPLKSRNCIDAGHFFTFFFLSLSLFLMFSSTACVWQ